MFQDRDIESMFTHCTESLKHDDIEIFACTRNTSLQVTPVGILTKVSDAKH